MIRSRHDALFGAFFLVVAGIYIWNTIAQLDIGTAFQMGAGYVPLLVGGGLAILGAVLLINSQLHDRPNAMGGIPWRAVGTICLATVAFAALLDTAGLFPAVVATCLLASLSKRMPLLPTLAAAICVGVFCTVIFYFIVRLPVGIIMDWKP